MQQTDLKQVNKLTETWLAMQRMYSSVTNTIVLYDYNRHTKHYPAVNEAELLTDFKNSTFLKRHGLTFKNLRDELMPYVL